MAFETLPLEEVVKAFRDSKELRFRLCLVCCMLELLSIASDEDRTEHENMSPCCIYYEGHRTFPELHSEFPKHFVHER